MRQIAMTGLSRVMGFSSCTAQKFSLILMQCSINLVMFMADNPVPNRLEGLGFSQYAEDVTKIMDR
jgi:hypothetical protein